MCVLAASAVSFAPPDERSWDEVTQNFTTAGWRHGGEDGHRLKALDEKHAAEFLLPFLSKSHPSEIRLKAIAALGKPGFQEAIAALSAIAKDESDELRIDALNSGLRYMKHPDAVRAAIDLTEDKSVRVRKAAYLVLGEHGTNRAVAGLLRRLRAKDAPAMRELVTAFLISNRRDAAEIVFQNCSLSDLSHDAIRPYATLMWQQLYAPAQENMLALLSISDHSIQATVINYFGAFPREDVVPHLIRYIQTSQFSRQIAHGETVTAFLESPNISAESKEKLRSLQAMAK